MGGYWLCMFLLIGGAGRCHSPTACEMQHSVYLSVYKASAEGAKIKNAKRRAGVTSRVLTGKRAKNGVIEREGSSSPSPQAVR